MKQFQSKFCRFLGKPEQTDPDTTTTTIRGVVLVAITLLLATTLSVNAATFTVTNGGNTGTGTLRQAVTNALAHADASSTINFSGVTTVNLTASIQCSTAAAGKTLIINGGSGVTIAGNNSSRIFYINTNNFRLEINNLNLTKSYSSGNGGAISFDYSSFQNQTLVANNCTFTENRGSMGAAVYIRAGNFTANNCTFVKNAASSSGSAIWMLNGSIIANNCTFVKNIVSTNGGAVCVHNNSTLIANNCTFDSNKASNGNGGAIHIMSNNAIFVGNCTFNENSAVKGGAILIENASTTPPMVYLYHNTFVRNMATSTAITNAGGAIYNASTDNKIYLYNCLYVGNLSGNLTPTTAGQIYGSYHSGSVGNLLENGSSITLLGVFGSSTPVLTAGKYILPSSACSIGVSPLSSGIEVPSFMSVSEVMGLISTDQAGATRPTTGNVTCGSVEVPQGYNLIAEVNNTAYGSVSTNPTSTTNLPCNTTVTLTADPAAGPGTYRFINWTYKGTTTIVSADDSFNFTLKKDTTIVANFADITTYTLTATSNPAYVTVTAFLKTSSTYVPLSTTSISALAPGSEVRLIATQTDTQSCNIFYWWENQNGSWIYSPTTNVLDVVVNSDTVIIAKHLTSGSNNRLYLYNIVGNGIVKIDGVPIDPSAAVNYVNRWCGSFSTVTAIPDDCNRFVEWTIPFGGGSYSTDNPLNLIMYDANVSLTAIFEPLPAGTTFDLTINVNDPLYGTATSSMTKLCGTIVALTAAPNPGYSFVGWFDEYGDTILTTSASFNFKILKDGYLTAIFEPVICTLTASANDNNFGSVTKSPANTSSLLKSTTVKLTATPNLCYEFVNWTSGATIISTSNPLNVVLSGDTTLVANFAPITTTFDLVVSSNNTSMGSITSTPPTTTGLNCGTAVTLKAIPNSKYKFLGWSADGGYSIIYTGSTYKFNIMSDRSLTAVFVKKGPMKIKRLNVKDGKVHIKPKP